MGEVKRIYRSRKNRIIAGVCGGIAEYLNIDPTIIRLLWVLFSLLHGVGIILYIIAAIIIPEEPREGEESGLSPGQDITKLLLLFLGVGLLCIGVIGFMIAITPWLLQIILPFALGSWLKFLYILKYVVFLILIIIGIILILKSHSPEKRKIVEVPSKLSTSSQPS